MSIEPGFPTDVSSVQRGARPVGRFAWLVGLATTLLMGLGLLGSPAAGHAAGDDRLVPKARLTPSGGPIDQGSIAMSGGVLVAGASGVIVGPSTQAGAGYVFTRPAGGWSDESEAAKLIPSDSRVGDAFGGSVAISGATAVVGSGFGAPVGSGLYVFTKPRGGWSGQLHERARLTVGGADVGPLGPVAITGDTIAVGATEPDSRGPGAVYVFNKPRRGWSGTIRPSARLSASHAAGYTRLGSAITVSGRNIFTTALNPDGTSGTIFVFSKPTRGWKGTIRQRARLTTRSMAIGPLAVSGSSVVAAIQSRLYERVVCELVAFQEPVRGWSGCVSRRPG